MERLSCGILVIGCGAAGLRVAVAAKEAGAEEVWVLSKSQPGLSTCMILSGGGLGAALGGFAREGHLSRTMVSGRGIKQRNLVETFVSEAPEHIEDLAAWGMKMSVSRPMAMGAHFRTDFPEQHEKWTGRQVVSLSPENRRQWSFMA